MTLTYVNEDLPDDTRPTEPRVVISTDLETIKQVHAALERLRLHYGETSPWQVTEFRVALDAFISGRALLRARSQKSIIVLSPEEARKRGRQLYNEMLKGDLSPHLKVAEAGNV